MDIKEFLKPNLTKLVITLILPALIGLILTFSISGGFTVYGLLLTPGYTIYANQAYYEWNLYILSWIPIYLTACTINIKVLKR